MSQFIESIRIQHQKPHLLDLHQQRLNDTLNHFNAHYNINLAKIIRNLNWRQNGLFKLRVVYNLEGKFTTQIVPYTYNEITSFELVEANALDYTFKYENRSEFERLKKQANNAEIVIIQQGNITDTSFSNLIFLKDDIWYTPTTYLLNGVQRQHLLKENKIQETEITTNTISEYTHFKLINAMNPMDEAFTYPIEKLLPEKASDEFYL